MRLFGNVVKRNLLFELYLAHIVHSCASLSAASNGRPLQPTMLSAADNAKTYSTRSCQSVTMVTPLCVYDKKWKSNHCDFFSAWLE